MNDRCPACNRFLDASKFCHRPACREHVANLERWILGARLLGIRDGARAVTVTAGRMVGRVEQVREQMKREAMR